MSCPVYVSSQIIPVAEFSLDICLQPSTHCLCGKRRWSEGQGASRKGRAPQREGEKEKEKEEERKESDCFTLSLELHLLIFNIKESCINVKQSIAKGS